MTRWTLLGIAVAALLALPAVGCNSKSPAPAPTSNGASPRIDAAATGGEETKLTRGGVPPAPEDLLLVAYGDDPDTLNAVTSSDTTSQAFQLRVYEYLARRKFDNPD